MYYVCDAQTDKVLMGPAQSAQVAFWISDQGEDQTAYYNASRYDLAKSGRYPRNKAGEAALAQDIETAKLAGFDTAETIHQVTFYHGWSHGYKAPHHQLHK